MKMYDFVVCVFFALKHGSGVHISEQAGLCRTCRSPEERFSCCSSRKRHNIRWDILLLVLIELRHKKPDPENIKRFHV